MRLLYFLVIILIGFTSLPVFALDLSSYQLTELQKNLLLTWEKENRFDEAKLLHFAQDFHNYNTRPQVYIPPHTSKDLQAVTEWAEGRAFAFFARYTPYIFNAEQYEDDCPYLSLFNFGVATEKAYLNRDVLEISLRTFATLSNLLHQSPEKFPEIYLKMVKAKGFGSYILENVEVSDASFSQ